MASSKQSESEQEAYATEQGRNQPRYPHNVIALLKFLFLNEGERVAPYLGHGHHNSLVHEPLSCFGDPTFGVFSCEAVRAAHCALSPRCRLL